MITKERGGHGERRKMNNRGEDKTKYMNCRTTQRKHLGHRGG